MPGLVFQGVVIGGGYGTGREIVEYFMRFGAIGGLLGMFVVTVPVWAIILAVTFEFARKFETYDYRSLLRMLLGRYWIVFELLYLVLMVIVLAVVGSAAGVLLRDYFGIPYAIGVFLMLFAVGFLTFKGSGLIERTFSVWSIVIYLVYLVFLVVAVLRFGEDISANLSRGEILPGWGVAAFKYGLYNMCVIPAILFCVRHVETRRQAVSAGVIAAFVGLLPAALFYVAILAAYPGVVAQELPSSTCSSGRRCRGCSSSDHASAPGADRRRLHSRRHGIQRTLPSGRNFLSWQHPLVATACSFSLVLARFGIIALVAAATA
jgi:uncharacterized membrane protein YkvI